MKKNHLFLLALLSVICLMHAGPALAAVAPAPGDFAYDLYDIAVNKILNGAIGFVAAAGAMAYGGVMAWQGQIWGAIPAVLGGAVVLSADTIAASLGAMI